MFLAFDQELFLRTAGLCRESTQAQITDYSNLSSPDKVIKNLDKETLAIVVNELVDKFGIKLLTHFIKQMIWY